MAKGRDLGARQVAVKDLVPSTPLNPVAKAIIRLTRTGLCDHGPAEQHRLTVATGGLTTSCVVEVA
jgi:hypothetical protein